MSNDRPTNDENRPWSLSSTLLIITVIIIAPIALVYACGGPEASAQETAKSLYWSDGDSGRIDGQEFRLADVDAPETGPVGSRNGAKCENERSLGYQVKAIMVELSRSGIITITGKYDVDRYGRQVMDIAVGGRDLAKWGLEKGALKPWPHEGSRALRAKPDWCS